MSDLKQVYGACIEEGVLNEPELFKDKWDSNCQRYIDPCMTTGLHYHMFHVPWGTQTPDLHNKCDRGIQPSASW